MKPSSSAPDFRTHAEQAPEPPAASNSTPGADAWDCFLLDEEPPEPAPGDFWIDDL